MQNVTAFNFKISADILCHLKVILRQTVTELFHSLLAGPVLRTFVQYSIAFCTRQEAANDVMSGLFVRLIVPNKIVKFRDPCLNRSREIRPKAIGDGSFDRFS